MATILKSLTDNVGIVLAILVSLILILGVIVVKLTFAQRAAEAKFRLMLNGATGADLQSVLMEHSQKRAELERETIALKERTDVLERKLQKSKRHVGIVRYDAFADVGGLQSFALAIYDDNGDGALISSIIGRAEARVYGKPILAGKSDRNLTSEEQQAIIEAVSNSPKSFVS